MATSFSGSKYFNLEGKVKVGDALVFNGTMYIVKDFEGHYALLEHPSSKSSRPDGLYRTDLRACSGTLIEVAVAPVVSDVDAWFDDHLKEPPPKKERVPDELDWEAHRAYMRSLR